MTDDKKCVHCQEGADWIDRASALLPLIPRDAGTNLAKEVSALLSQQPPQPTASDVLASNALRERDALQLKAYDWQDALRPFVEFFELQELTYRKRGGTPEHFPDTHPFIDIEAGMLPLGVWRRAQRVYRSAVEPEAPQMIMDADRPSNPRALIEELTGYVTAVSDRIGFAKALQRIEAALIPTETVVNAAGTATYPVYQEDRTSLPVETSGQRIEPFVVRHYTGDERPMIKGNGFDGLEVGSDREEAQGFVDWINARLRPEEPEAPKTCTCTPPSSGGDERCGWMTSGSIDPNCPIHWRQGLIQNGTLKGAAEKASGELPPAFQSLVDLEPNWDSYGAKRIRPDCIQKAYEIWKQLAGTWLPVPHSDGTVGLEQHSGGFDIEIDVDVCPPENGNERR